MNVKTCPYCAEEIKAAAIKCRYCGTHLEPQPKASEWYRELDSKMLGGVCAGLSRQFGISATALRIAFIVAAFIGGWGLLIYIALWIIMPVTRPVASTPALPELPKEPGLEPVETEDADEELDSQDSDSAEEPK